MFKRREIDELIARGSAWDIEPVSSEAWNGDVLWGMSKSSWPAAVAAGIQLTSAVGIGEFRGYGPPQLYEVRLTVLWHPDNLAFGAIEGLLQCDIVYGAGAASHRVTIDASHSTSIVVPAGTISLSIRQVGTWNRTLLSVSASIARYAGGQVRTPSCSIYPNETSGGGPTLRASGAFPTRAKSVIVHGRYSSNVYRLSFLYGGITEISSFDSGSDRLLMQTGVPIPPHATTWELSRPSVPFGGNPVLQFLLD